MSFADLPSDSGLQALNCFLATKSYIEGYQASQADVAVYEAVKSAPCAKKYPHVARWYTHITALDKKALPGTKKAASAYGPQPVKPKQEEKEEEEDDIDLFGSDEEEDAEAEKLKAERLAEYHAKKAKKPAVIHKSMITLDVKPWDDETDMVELERLVRSIEMDGLIWGTSKLIAIGYGIRKLQIACVVEDAKVATDDLDEKITAFEDFVQSVDIAAFQKI